MRMNLEDDLTRTFRAAALAAPGSRAGVLGRGGRAPAPAHPEPDGRTDRRVTAVVAVAAGVAALGLTAVRHADPAQPPDARPLPAGSRPTVDLSAVKPYQEVWPDAIVELPYPLPDGRRYAVEAALGADTYLADAVDRTSP